MLSSLCAFSFDFVQFGQSGGSVIQQEAVFLKARPGYEPVQILGLEIETEAIAKLEIERIHNRLIDCTRPRPLQ